MEIQGEEKELALLNVALKNAKISMYKLKEQHGTRKFIEI